MNTLNLRLLNKELKSGNISHSYLFHGENMKHLFELALNFAANINCKKGGCLDCSTCKNTLKAKYPNLYVLEPMGNVITVEEISELNYLMSISSINNEFKIAVIKEADLMSDITFNKMLKILEDPPDEKCIFLLLVEDVNTIMQTVKSRCQIYNWFFKGKSSEKFDEKLSGIEDELKDLLKKLISDRSNISSALNFSGSVNGYIPKIGEEIIKKQKKEIEKIKKSGLDEDETGRIIKKIEADNKREISKLTSLIIKHVFDIITICLEDIIAVMAGSKKEALHYADNYNIINESFRGEGINKYLELLNTIRENKIYANQGINYEIALDRVMLGLVRP